MRWLQWSVVLSAALAMAVKDVRTGRIPNRLTGPLLVAGLGWSVCVGGAPGLADALAACLLLACPYVLLFVLAGGGAGDAKLMGAVGAWLGVVNGIVVLLCVLVAGAVLAFGYALARRRLGRLVRNLGQMLSAWTFAIFVRAGGPGAVPQARLERQTAGTMPYGLGIFAGAFVAAGGIFAWRLQ